MARKLKPFNQLSKAGQYRRRMIEAQAKGGKRKAAPTTKAQTRKPNGNGNGGGRPKAPVQGGLIDLLRAAQEACTGQIAARADEMYRQAVEVQQTSGQVRTITDILKEMTKVEDPISLALVGVLKLIQTAQERVGLIEAGDIAKLLAANGTPTHGTVIATPAPMPQTPVEAATEQTATSVPAEPKKAKRKAAAG